MVVKNEEGKELQSIALIPQTGINTVDYDLSISEKGKKLLEKENSELNISKQKNGKYYLPKGKYTLELQNAGITTSTGLEVK